MPIQRTHSHIRRSLNRDKKMKYSETIHKRDGMKSRMKYIILMLFVVLAAFGITDSAEANFNNFGGNPCTNCHDQPINATNNAGLDVRIAIDGVETVTANVNAGDTIEVDFFNFNVKGDGDKSEGHFIEVPTGWGPMTAGTANAKPAGWTAWSSSWDLAGGTVNGWVQEYINTNLWTTRTTSGTNWAQSSTGTMCNDGSIAASGSDKCADLDDSLYHGSDFQIQIPPGTSTGTYYINMTFVGHLDAGFGGTKGNYPQQLTINVTGAGGDTQTLDSFTDDSADSAAPVTDLRMAKIATTASGAGVALTASQVTVAGTLSALTEIKVWWNTVDNFGTATQVGIDSSPTVGVGSNIILTGAGGASGFLYYTISIPGGATGSYDVTVSSVTGNTTDNIGLPSTTATRNVTVIPTQELDTFTDDSADTAAPAADFRMVKIATSATSGGAALTASQVTVNGTLSALTDIKVFWNTVDNFGTATEVGSDLVPAVSTPSNITLTGAGSATGYLYYTITIPGGATGSYDVTVTSVTGNTTDNIGLPSTTATRNVTVIPTQELDTFTDDSADTTAPAADFRMAKIATSATSGGAALTATQVTVNGTLSALTDIKVFWNTVDDFGSASEVGSDLAPAVSTPSNISLSGAGSATGYLYYTITIPGGATGSYDVTVTSVTGNTTDNIGLPSTTATRNVTIPATQELDTFTDDSADTTAPAADFRMAKIATSATSGGAALTASQVTVNGTLSALTDIKVFWNTVDNFGTATQVGSDSSPVIATPSNITLTGAGSASGFLYYTITIPGGAMGSYDVTVTSVTGNTTDNIGLPSTTATRNITVIPTQVLDTFTDDSANAAAPAADLRMAKIATTAANGGVALTASQVTVNGTLSAISNIKVWWNTVDNFGTASEVGSDLAPVVATPSNITLTGAGNASGFLYYTITVPGGATGTYDVTVTSVTGNTVDSIGLPSTTSTRSVNTQTLDAITDDSANSSAPVTDLRMAKITTTGTGDGSGLTASQVTVSGTLSAISNIKVWWNTVDNFGTASEVGSDLAPVVATPSNITLTGAGNASGFLYYTITLPAGASGTYDVTVTSVTGNTADSIGLPSATASKTVSATQTLDTFTDDSANSTEPVTNLRMAKITTTANAGGAGLTASQVTVSGTLSALTDIKVWWNTVDNFGTASEVGSDLAPVVATPSNITLTGAGSASGFLYYTISIPEGATGTYDVTVTSVTGNTSDSIGLPSATASRTVLTDPEVVSGPTASNTDDGSFVDSPFDLTARFDDKGFAISSCDYDIVGGWNAAAVSGSGAATDCDASPTCTDGAALTIQMRATNANGTATTGSISRTCDAAAPAAIADLNSTGFTDVEVTLAWSDPSDGTGSGNATYDVRYVTGPAFLEAQWAGATDPGSEPVPPSTGITVTGLLASTEYTFAIKTTDSVSNQAVISNTVTVTTSADGTIPVTSNIQVTLNEFGTFAGDPFDLSGDITDNESDVTVCEYCVKNGSECTSGDTWAAGVVSGVSPTWTCSATGVAAYTAGGGFTDGDSIFIDARGTSAGGTNNEGGTSLQRTSDNSAPATIADFASSGNAHNTADLTWSDPSDGTGSGNASYDVRYVTGASFLEAQWAGATDAGLEPTPPTTGMTVSSLTPSTQYTFAIKTTDNVNNTSVISNTVTLTTDAAPDLADPTAAITNLSDGQYLNSSALPTFTINGTASDDIQVQDVDISIDGGAWAPATTCTACGTASGNWTYDWTLPADGTYTVQARATDTSLNTFSTAILNINIDTTGPSVSAQVINLLDTTELTGHTWTEQSSAPGIVLPDDASEIIITVDTMTGSGGGDTADLWVDDVSIIYVPDPPPTSAISDPVDLQDINTGSANPYTITGSASDNGTIQDVEISIDGGPWTSVTTCAACGNSTGAWTYDWTLPVTDASYTIQSRAIDNSGNTETPAAAITVTVDLNDPSSVVSDPADASTLNASSPDPYTVSGTASDALEVASVDFYDGTSWQTATCGDCPGTNVNWTYVWNLPVDGGYTLNSRATDSAGNVETPGAGNNVTISTTGPAVDSTNPADAAGGIALDSNVIITFDTNTVDCATVDNTTVTYSGGAANWTKAGCVIDQPLAGQTLATFTPSSQVSATTYTISVTTGVLDTIGNPATAYQFSYSTIDVDPPASIITDPVDSTAFNSGSPGTINITGTASDNVAVSSVEVQINGGGWSPATCTGCPGMNIVWSYSWPRPASDGSYTIQSRGIDAAPNTETPGAGNTVTVDVSVPSSTITAPANGTYLNSGDFPYNINGSAVDTGTNITGVEVSTDGGNSWAAAVCTGCGTQNVTWTYNWTTPSNESNYVVRVRATDAGNNVEEPAAGNTATYDNTAPVVASASPDNNDSNVAVDRDVVIAFTEDNLDCGTVNTTNITSDSPGWTMSNCDDVTGIVTFTTSGQSNYSTYNANITTSVADKSGNTLASAYPISYEVGTLNSAPGNPSALAQYKTDDTTSITQGTTTDETSIVIWANVTDSDSDNVLIEAEIVLNASSFTGTPNCTIGDTVSTPGTAKVTCGNLADGSSYKWQIRAYDGRAYSSWVDYSGGNPDVQIVTLLSSSALIHNSTNVKDASYGTWGVSGGKYGEFVCSTCHTDSTTNIKRVKTAISSPSAENWPSGSNTTGTITLTQADSTNSDLGDNTSAGGYTGVCNVCHDNVNHDNYTFDSYLDHNPDKDCTNCHYHNAGFKNVGGGGDCKGCHTGVPGTTYVSRDVVNTDFQQSSRHVFGGTVTNWDCIVCHKEGDEAKAAIGEAATTAFHPFGNGTVDLRDVDNPTAAPVVVWDKYDGTCAGGSGGSHIDECITGGGTWTWSTDQMLTDMDTFCMKCHDSDFSRGADLGGASGIAVNATDTGVELRGVTADPLPSNIRLKPFNTTDGLDVASGGGTMTLAGYERFAVLDAYGMFNTTNESFHPVRGQAYANHEANWGNTAWVDRTLKNGTRLITDNVYEKATLHCADCHTVDQNGHGGANGFMLTANSIDDTCYLCHNSTTYSDDKSSTDTRWWHGLETNAWNVAKISLIGNYNGNDGSFCRNCHGGLIGETGSFNDGYGGIHGMDTSLQGADPRTGEPRYRFQGGIYMSHNPGDWTGTADNSPTCYFSASKTVDWSACGQHNSDQTGRTDPPRYSRGVPGDY